MLQEWGIKCPSEYGEMDETDRVFIQSSWNESIKRYNKAVK